MSEIKNKYLYELSMLKESEDHVEFKEAKRNFNFDGGDRRGIVSLDMWPRWQTNKEEGWCSV